MLCFRTDDDDPHHKYQSYYTRGSIRMNVEIVSIEGQGVGRDRDVVRNASVMG